MPPNIQTVKPPVRGELSRDRGLGRATEQSQRPQHRLRQRELLAGAVNQSGPRHGRGLVFGFPK